MTYEIKHVSPSQIETWLGCQRQWYWEYPMGIKAPPKPSALIGTACHTVAEDFILEQKDEDLATKQDGKDQYRAIVRPAYPDLQRLRLLVQAGHGHVELEMKRPLRNGLVLKGRIDFVSFHDPYEPLVVDHKTTSDLRYAKTEEELRTNVQMVAYAYDAACRATVSPLRGVRVAHNVMLTRGPATARYTDVLIPIREVHEGWRRINDLSDKMLGTAAIASPADVPENRSSCSKFGGCFHLARCQALWAAQSGGAAQSPYATPGEVMPDVAPLPAHLLTKITGRPAPVGLLPPEAPQNPRDRKAEAAGITAQAAAQQAAATQKASTQHVAVAPALPADPGEMLLALGWTGDEVNAMTDKVFEKVVAERWERKVCEVGFGDPESDGFQPIVRVNPNATQIHQLPPVRRQRVAAPAAPAPVVPVVVETPPAPVVPDEDKSRAVALADAAQVNGEAPAQPVAEAPRRRGRPPGSKNAATLAREQAQPAQPAPAADPVVAALQEGLDEAHTTVPQASPETRAVEAESALEDADAAMLEQAEIIADLKEKLTDYKADWEKHLATIQELRAANADLLAKTNGGSAGGFTLYIDCLPEKAGVPYRVLDEVLAPFMALAAANYKNAKGVAEPVSHYTLIPYNAGPGAVAAYVLTNLDKVVQPGILYVDTASPCAAAVLEVLRPKADAIVRAARR